ncbi:hypothetical protein BDZ89DRAFT_1034987 [Hymenopellis radicata]|nr:hypothetical protein BDZ89DRAFT_1034987 [Hymenopellis radicata]
MRVRRLSNYGMSLWLPKKNGKTLLLLPMDEKRMKAPLLAAIKKYFDVTKEEKEIAVAASDQSRLTTSGGGDSTRLLREEKNTLNKSYSPHFLYESKKSNDLSSSRENKRKLPRAGSVPPRSTTPASHSYVPMKSGVVIPWLKCGLCTEQAYETQRVNGSRSTRLFFAEPNGSWSKLSATLSLPRPKAMPIPKPGTQHHALGHGRVPSTVTGRAGEAGEFQAAAEYGPYADVNLGASTRRRAGFAASVREEDGY